MSDPTGPAAHEDLARRLAERCWVAGSFTLRSGQRASTYFDKFRFTSDPELLREVAGRLALLVPDGTQLLAGLELGGVPLAAALALETGLPAVYVRREAKAYGTAKLAEGPEVEGRHLTVVEDVISTGGQVAMSAGQLRALGARVDHALCVVDRTDGDTPLLDDAGITLYALFTSADVPVPTEPDRSGIRPPDP
jgi:orotate phosphoribosyltransferase